MSPELFLIVGGGALFIVSVLVLCFLEIKDEKDQREDVLSFYKNYWH